MSNFKTNHDAFNAADDQIENITEHHAFTARVLGRLMAITDPDTFARIIADEQPHD